MEPSDVSLGARLSDMERFLDTGLLTGFHNRQGGKKWLLLIKIQLAGHHHNILAGVGGMTSESQSC